MEATPRERYGTLTHTLMTRAHSAKQPPQPQLSRRGEGRGRGGSGTEGLRDKGRERHENASLGGEGPTSGVAALVATNRQNQG